MSNFKKCVFPIKLLVNWKAVKGSPKIITSINIVFVSIIIGVGLFNGAIVFLSALLIAIKQNSIYSNMTTVFFDLT